jgi:hypothetical protein
MIATFDDLSPERVTQVGAPFAAALVAAVAGWLLSTKVGRTSNGRWAADGLAAIAGLAAGTTFGLAIASTLVGSHTGSGAGPAGIGLGIIDVLARMIFGGLGGLAGGFIGLAFAEQGSGAGPGAYVAAMSTIALGQLLGGAAALLTSPHPLEPLPDWVPYAAFSAAVCAAASLGSAAFNAVRRAVSAGPARAQVVGS